MEEHLYKYAIEVMEVLSKGDGVSFKIERKKKVKIWFITVAGRGWHKEFRGDEFITTLGEAVIYAVNETGLDLSSSEQNPERSVARDDAQSDEAGKQK